MTVTNFKSFLGCIAALLMIAGSAQAGLLISGVMDGTLTGGSPKVVELAACGDVPDLSKYAVSIASNGSSTFTTITSDYILPSVSVSDGDFYYAIGNAFDDMTGDFDTVYPAYSGIRSLNYGSNSNGDDVIGLFYDATGAFAGGEVLVDVAGELGVDGTGQPWEYLDGWMYRQDGTGPSTTFNASDWYYSGPNAMDGFTEAQIAASFPAQTYTCIPEPATVWLLALAGLALVGLRRRVR